MNRAGKENMGTNIRAWLMATSKLEIPVGLSREIARVRGRELLGAIETASVSTDEILLDYELDILWAVSEELNEKEPCQETFEICDRTYQFIAGLRMDEDPFDERDDVLRRIAGIGWRSDPGGLDRILRQRALIWENSGGKHFRDLCATADRVTERVGALEQLQEDDLAEFYDLCASLISLGNLRPHIEVAGCEKLFGYIANTRRRLGWLDDREFLKGATALAAAMGNRQLARWEAANSGYGCAEAAFRRTVNTNEVDRVRVERLALSYARGRYEAVAKAAPRVIRSIIIPRERIKASLTLATALVDLDRLADAEEILGSVCRDSVIEKEPALWAYALMKLGNALSGLGRDAEAIASFDRCSSLLSKHPYPVLLGTLASSMGEHLTKSGDLSGAAYLYERARDLCREAGQAQLVCYQSVLLAETLMLLGRYDQAEEELLTALPYMERFNLRREAVAAVALLQVVGSRRRTNSAALQSYRDQVKKVLP